MAHNWDAANYGNTIFSIQPVIGAVVVKLGYVEGSSIHRDLIHFFFNIFGTIQTYGVDAAMASRASHNYRISQLCTFYLSSNIIRGFWLATNAFRYDQIFYITQTFIYLVSLGAQYGVGMVDDRYFALFAKRCADLEAFGVAVSIANLIENNLRGKL